MQGGVGLGVHSPEHGAAVVLGVGRTGGLHQRAPELQRRSHLSPPILRILLSCRSSQAGALAGIVAGLALVLGQTGHNTQGHPGGAALAVEDGLVHCQADALGQHLHDPRGQIDVVVLQEGIAHRHIARHLVAVQGDLIEHKIQFVDGPAHLRPHSLGHSARDGLTGLAV